MSIAPTNREDEHMFAYRIGRSKGIRGLAWGAAIVAIGFALAVAGCGDSGDSGVTVTGTDETAEADPADVAVIEDWSETLSEGDVEGAAELFATPSTAENGSLRVEIKTAEEAVAFNETLPCGAELLTAETDGDITTATFELSDRPGGNCGSGAGGEAATEFRIEDGEIVEWRRVAVPGGEAPAPGGASPGAPV